DWCDRCEGHAQMMVGVSPAPQLLLRAAQWDDDTVACPAVRREAGVDARRKLFGRERVRPQPPHRGIAAELTELGCLFGAFDSFGGHLHAERMTHRHNGLHDGEIRRRALETVDERLVEL